MFSPNDCFSRHLYHCWSSENIAAYTLPDWTGPDNLGAAGQREANCSDKSNSFSVFSSVTSWIQTTTGFSTCDIMTESLYKITCDIMTKSLYKITYIYTCTPNTSLYTIFFSRSLLNHLNSPCCVLYTKHQFYYRLQWKLIINRSMDTKTNYGLREIYFAVFKIKF